jgi:hypothetical protein
MKIILLEDFGPFIGLGLLLAIVMTFTIAFLALLVKGKNSFYKRLLLIAVGIAIFCFTMRRIFS